MTHDHTSEHGNDDNPPALLATSRSVTTRQLATVSSPLSGGLPPNLFLRKGFTSPPPAGAVLNNCVFINSPFALLGLYFPTLSNPVAGYDGGLNAAALAVSPLGVICIVPSYLKLAEFDFISLLVNGVQVAFHTVSEDEALNKKPIVLFINSSRFVDQSNNTVQAFLTPLLGGPVATQLFNILVDRQLPVGPDPVGGTPDNENMESLKFTDPRIDAFGFITQQDTQLGVEVQIGDYPIDRSLPQVHWRKEGDIITVIIGDVTYEHTVTAFEASGTAPITFTLYFGIWSLVSDGAHLIRWMVRDKVGNQSPGHSPPRMIHVDSGSSTEPSLPPVFASESDFDPARDQDFLDTRLLTGDTPLELLIRNQGYLVGDTVVITVRGLSAEGSSSELIINYSVTVITPIRVYIPLSLGFLLQLSGGLILITYKRLRAGAPDRPSQGALYAIDGEPLEDGLKAPIVLDLDSNGALPADTNPVRILVQEYFGQLPNDRVDLIVTGFKADGTPVYATFTDMAGIGDLIFLLENAFFQALDGGYIVVYYEINGAAHLPASKSVTLPVGDAQAALPPPWTVQATPPDLTFDPLINLANLNVRVNPHPAIVEDAQVRLIAMGTRPGGSFTSAWFDVDENWVGNVLPFTVARLIVLANLDSTMRLYYEIVQTPGATPLFSKDLIINIGTPLGLPTPLKVLEATNATPDEAELNPLHVLPPSPRIVTFQVPAADLLPTDDVTVYVKGMPGLGEPTIASKSGIPDAGQTHITFTVISDFVAAYLGSFCDAYFTVNRNGNLVESAHLKLNVQALPASSLDVVSVPQASSSNVITTGIPNEVKVLQWPFFKSGQAVFIELDHASGGHTLRAGSVVTAQEFISKQILELIPSSYLPPLPNGSSLKISVKVSLDGNNFEGTAVNLEPRTYTLSSVPALTIPSDTRNVNLAGWLLVGFDVNVAAERAYLPTTRTASGGKTPYKYASSNAAVVSVNAATGVVYVNNTGTVTITVTDSSVPPQTASYQIQVGGAYRRCRRGGNNWDWHTAKYYESVFAAGLPTYADYSSLRARFGSNWPLNDGAIGSWTPYQVTTVPGNPDSYYVVSALTGAGLPPYDWFGPAANQRFAYYVS